MGLARKLGDMAVTAAAKRSAGQMSHGDLVKGVLDGSSFCALALARRIRAISVDELVLEIGGLPDDRKGVVFDAIADGFSVFDDARCRDLL